MISTEELFEALRKAKANLASANEQAKNAEEKYELCVDQLLIAKETYRKAVSAIELAAN